MAKIYVYAGIAFFLYSDDHDPIHLHIRYQGNEFRAMLTYTQRDTIASIEWKRVKGSLTQQVKRDAERLIKRRSKDIRKKWNDIHILHKHVKPITILRLK